MDIKVYEILDYLNQFGVGQKQNIAHILNGLFPIEENIQMHVYNNETGNIFRFIEALKPYLTFSSDPDFNSHNSFPTEYLNPLFASINNDGVAAIENENQKHLNRVLNKSAIETNESIKATNESVRITNQALLEVSKEQGIINTGIIDNSQKQTQILRRQTLIFLFTGVFSLGSLITSGITLYRDISKDTLQTQLKQQSKELQLLRLKIQELSSKNHAVDKIDTLKN